MATEEVCEQPHKEPQFPNIPPQVLAAFAFSGGFLLVIAGVYLIIVAADKVKQKVDPDPTFRPIAAEFCTYYQYSPVIPAGKRGRLKIADNEISGLGAGSVEIYVTPVGMPLPPGGEKPRTTFGGNGETTVNGPGLLTVHVGTTHTRPNIHVWIEDIV